MPMLDLLLELLQILGFESLIKPGETACVLDLANGAHISFGKWGGAGVRGINLVSYPFNDKEMNIDIDGAVKLIKKLNQSFVSMGDLFFYFLAQLKI